MRTKFIPTDKYEKEKGENYEFEEIAKGCIKNDKDNILFCRYATKRISLEHCLNDFKKNNHITEDIKLSKFERWLASIGWRRDDKS